MTAPARQLLVDLKSAGITVEVAGKRLKVTGLDKLPECDALEVMERIRRDKPAILEVLTPSEFDEVDEKSLPPPKPEPYRACGGRDFWRNAGGVHVCRRCHPPAPGVLEWLGLASQQEVDQ